MITFDITFDADPNAVGAYLEYRYLLSDGSYTNWEVALSPGVFAGYFPISTPQVTLNAVVGNPPDFEYNTTYDFRIRQLCGLDGTELLSPIDPDYFDFQCPPYTVEYGEFAQPSGAFPVEVTIPSTVGSSIIEYTFSLYTPNNPIPIASAVIPNTVVEGGLPYTFVFDDNNVPGGIVQGVAYLATIGLTILISGGGTFDITCPPKQIQIPPCTLWKIETGDDWVIEWTDCNGQSLLCASKLPYLNPNTNDILYVCSPFQPIGYYCNNNNPIPTILDPNGSPTQGALVLTPNAGPCDPALYNYNAINPAGPILNGRICLLCQ